jgi:hypothetical protein
MEVFEMLEFFYGSWDLLYLVFEEPKQFQVCNLTNLLRELD